MAVLQTTLINKADIQVYRDISNAIEDARLNAVIVEAQWHDVRPILGDPLWNAFVGFRWKVAIDASDNVTLERYDNPSWTVIHNEVSVIGTNINATIYQQNANTKPGTTILRRFRLANYLHSTELP